MRRLPPGCHRRPRACTRTVVGAFMLLASLLGRCPVPADEPGESDESAQLVHEATALIVNTPRDLDGTEVKITEGRRNARSQACRSVVTPDAARRP
jgi:hypothetical protein